MKICIITLFYKPAGGGIPRYVDNLSKSLSNIGHEVDIITVSYDENKKIVSEGKITIYYLPFLNIFGKSNKECMEKSKSFLNFMKNYLEKKKVDVIVAQNLHAAISSVGHTFMLNSIAMEKNIPLILTIHSFPEEPYSELKISLAKNLFWDKIITVSSSVAEVFCNSGIEVDKIKIIPPGVDINLFKPNLGKKWLRSHVDGLDEKDIIILHASRTDSIETIEEKGIKTLLKAFSFIHERYKNIKLLIASAPVSPPFEESKKKALENLIDTIKLYHLQDKVKIATFQPEEMPLVYNGCDIFAMASKLESFGIVYTEAMACRLPVIGTSVGGTPEIIVNGKNGYLVSSDNPVELSKYLSLLLGDSKKRKKFGEYGRKRILSKFDINKISVKRVGNYQSLIHHKNKKKTKFDFLKRILKK